MNMIRLTVMGLIAFALSACASVETRTPGDPLEPLNRAVFGFNEALDEAIILPLTNGYTVVTPDPVEVGIANAFDNVREPTTFANQLLQGKPRASATTFARFGVNTTLGIGGLFDVASGMGLTRGDEDLGQTFGVWGVPSGPYLVLPVLGSSTLRDLVGRSTFIPATVPFYIDDTEAIAAYLTLSTLSTSAQFVDARGALTGDRYLLMRDAYLQRREFLVNDGRVTAEDPFLDD
jgi:phospholipid-binding lipoprotein MlaA